MKREYLYNRPRVSGEAGSPWLAEAEGPSRPQVTGIVEADVAVVGAGLCGTLTALQLAEAGLRVALVEGRRIASLVTGHTTAKATAQHGLVSANVSSNSRIPWLKANVAAVDKLQSYASWADSPFERADSHVYITNPNERANLEREAQLYADMGLDGGLVEAGDLLPFMAGAVRLAEQAYFDPVALIDGLLEQAPSNLLVFEESLVREVREENGIVSARTAGGEVQADALVVASHVPFFDTLLYMTRLFQQRHYALELTTETPAPDGMWYSEDHDAVAWRPRDGEDATQLVISGISHKAGQGGDERERYADLERASVRQLGPLTVQRHWSTQDAHTPDSLPYIGKMHGRDHCFFASGFGGWGMTTSVVAADILTALVTRNDHELAEVVSPARVSAGGMMKLAVENADFVAQAFSHELPPITDPSMVPPGEGRDVRTERGHLAVERMADGSTHVRDAHCTHMRCTVEYNEAEGTWDCPCHGSRYYGDGQWLQGPTRRGLDPPHEAEDA